MAIYGQTLGFEFVRLDDATYLLWNGVVSQGLSLEGLRWAFTTDYDSNWFPLTWLSWMLDVELHGLDPSWHHATNVALHLANSLLLLWVLASATGRAGASGLVAALFALHPLHVEAVAWVSERKEVLSALFGILAMASYVAYARRGGAARYSLVALCLALSLMAKPMWVTLPLALLLLDLWPLERLAPGGEWRRVAPRLVLEKVPLLGLSLASSLITLRVQKLDPELGLASGAGLLDSVENAVVSYALYLWKTLWPANLAVLYPHPAMPSDGGVPLTAVQVAGALAALLAISLGVLRARRRYLWTGWLWYLGTLVPVIGLVQVGRQAMADRYSYVPLIGIFVMLAFGGDEVVRRWQRRWSGARPAAAALACAALVALAAVAHAQTRVWRDSVSLFEHALRVTPRNPTVHYNLGNTYGSLGRLDDAVEQYRLALETKPEHHKAHYNLANILRARGRRAEAMTHYREALRIFPDYALAHHGLGELLVQAGRLEEALHHYERSLEIDPNQARVKQELGLLRRSLGSEAP